MVWCIYNINRRCFHRSCSLIDKSGNVFACPLHPNPDGFLTRKVRDCSQVSIFVLLNGQGKRRTGVL
jgi:hypothetical protein